MENSDVLKKETVKYSPYLQELFQERQVIQKAYLNLKYTPDLLDKEIARVKNLISFGQSDNILNDKCESLDDGLSKTSNPVTKQDKIFLPVKEYPNFNFVGRILGPRGLTIKQFEKKLECRIMIRGRGSTRNPKQEEMNRGQPNYEHLNEDLHILIVVSDDENVIDERIKRIQEELKKFIYEPLNIPESQDTVKQMQLMELSILNESDRQQQQQQQRQQLIMQQQLSSMITLPHYGNSSIFLDPLCAAVATVNGVASNGFPIMNLNGQENSQMNAATLPLLGMANLGQVANLNAITNGTIGGSTGAPALFTSDNPTEQSHTISFSGNISHPSGTSDLNLSYSLESTDISAEIIGSSQLNLQNAVM